MTGTTAAPVPSKDPKPVSEPVTTPVSRTTEKKVVNTGDIGVTIAAALTATAAAAALVISRKRS